MRPPASALALLVLGAVAALGFGAFGLLAPESTAEAVSLTPDDAFGRGEIRAIYGGLWLAMGILLLTATFRLARTRATPSAAAGRNPERVLADDGARATERIRSLALAWVGLPIGRTIGWALDGGGGGPVLAFLLGELAMIGALLGGLALTARSRAGAPHRA